METIPRQPSPKKGKKQLKRRLKRTPLAQKAVKDRGKNLFIRLQESPEGQALWKLWTDRKMLAKRGRSPGHLDGYTLKVWKKLQARAQEEAKIIVRYMMEKEMIPKGEYAKEALETVVEVMRLPSHPRDKVAAAKIVLEWTMAKPASESTVNVKTAEDFLAEVAKDAGIE